MDGLVTAIRRFCDGWNRRCQLFRWTEDTDQTLVKLTCQDTSATDH
jgi:hypothetical protein